jgi:Zn-dependent protease with chaperone function
MTARQGGSPAAAGRFAPADRVSFLAEQRRRRRQTWRLSALCTLAVAITGLPLSVVLTPIVYALLLGALRLGGAVIALPAPLWSGLRRVGGLLPSLFEAMGRSGAHVPASRLAVGGALIVAPGIVAALLLWLALRALFLRAGTGGLLLAFGAREARAGDIEERQLADLAEEMAIAAGLPPPRVRLIDTPAANAAVVGASPAEAVIVVTRGLLDTLDRAQTEAVVGHLVGSAGDGDLRIAVTIASAFHGMALAITAFQAAIGLSGSAWRDLGHAVRWAFFQRGDPAAAEAVSEMLARELTSQRDDGIAAVITSTEGSQPKAALARAVRAFPPLKVLLFPLYLPYVGVLLLGAEVFMLRTMVAGPLVMLVWHARRYLADAMAVQLTRDPDALAGALERLAQADTAVPNSQWAGHLFVVAPKASRESGGGGADGAAEGFGGFVGSHPSIRRRLKRLASLGAAMAAAGAARRLPAGAWVGFALLAPLLILVAVLLGFAVGMIFVLAGMASLLMAGVALAVIARILL